MCLYPKLAQPLSILWFVCSLVSYYAIGQPKPTQSFTLLGQLPQGSKGRVYLLDQDDKPLDSTTIQKAQFAFKGSLPEPGLCRIQFNHSSKKYPIFLDSSPVRVSIEENGQYQVNGSILHNQWAQYTRQVQLIKQQLSTLYRARDTAQLKGDTILFKKLSRQNDSISRYYQTYLRDQIARKPYSYFNLFLLKQARMSGPYTASMLNEFRPYLSEYPTFQHFGGKSPPKSVPQAMLVGQKAYDFCLPDSTGASYCLERLRSANKLVVVEFWASWCRPCLEQLPSLKALEKRFQRQGLVVVTVSIDSDEQRWHKALRRYRPVGVQLLSGDKSPLLTYYGVDSVPQTLLIDRAGQIQGQNLGGEELIKKVVDLLTKAP